MSVTREAAERLRVQNLKQKKIEISHASRPHRPTEVCPLVKMRATCE
jgi:hypothetical protein